MKTLQSLSNLFLFTGITKVVLIGWLCLLLFPVSGTMARNVEHTAGDSLLLKELLTHWSQQHKVDVFIPENFSRTFHVSSSLLNLPLREALAQIERVSGLELHELYGVYVFTEGRLAGPVETSADDAIIVVGRDSHMGRQSRVLLRGEVEDGTTGETLPGAIVFSVSGQQGVSTGSDGRFELELSAGEHTVEVSFMGFMTRTYQLRINESGNVAFRLFSDSYNLAEVVVHSSAMESNHRSTQMSLIRLNAQELNNIPGSYGERDIVRSISLLPGVQSAGEFGTGFHVRGGAADQNLILVENLPVFNASNLFGMLSMVNPDVVDNASLYKGGMPARYGERASAVLDIKLDREPEDKTLIFKAGVGLLNTRMMSKASFWNKRASLFIAGRSTYSNWLLENTPDAELMNSRAGFYDFTSLLSIQLNTFNQLAIFGFNNNNKADFAGNTRYAYANTLGGVRWDSYLNPQTSSTLMMGFSHYAYRAEDNIEKAPLRQLLIDSELLYRSLKWNLHYQPSTLRSFDFGINAMDYTVEPGQMRGSGAQSQVEGFDLQQENALELSAYISAAFELHPRLSLEAGLRYTRFVLYGPHTHYLYADGMPVVAGNLTDSVTYGRHQRVYSSAAPEPRISLRWLTDSLSSIKLSYTRSFQYLNLISSSSIMTPADTWKLSNDYLRPLRVDQLAVGYFRSFAAGGYEASLEVYYKDLKNSKVYTTAAQIVMNPHLEQDISLADGHSYGAEALVRKNTGRLTGWMSYTYSRAFSQTHSPFPEKQINENALFPSDYDRPHNLVMNAGLQLSRRWRANALFTMASGRPLTLPEQGYYWGGDFHVSYSDRNKYRFPDYHRLDISISLDESLRLTRHFKGSWSLSIINVYGRKNPYSIFYEKDPPSPGNSYRGYSLYQLYIIGRPLPTLTYNLSF